MNPEKYLMLRLRRNGVIKKMVIKILNNSLEKVDEKIILIAIAGTLETLKNGGITIEEAENFLFSPHIVKELKKKKCNKDIIELIIQGCELEDIISLIPEELNDIIDELKQKVFLLLKKYESFEEEFWFSDQSIMGIG